MTLSSLPFTSIENDFLRVDYLTSIGPRIIGLYAKGVDGNILAETPDVHWPTPHGDYYLRGGHRLWIAPENPFYTCPEDNVSVITENDLLILRSNIDASGLEKEISLRLNENRVELTHRVTWHRNEPMAFALWAITQIRLGSVAILPQSNSDGLLPNRNLVLWPYSQVNDVRLELHDDLILIYGQASEQAFKVGHNNSQGWVACALGDALFVKRFPIDATKQYADMGCNAEAYVKDSCLELETLGSLTILEPKASATHKETWEVSVGEYPPTLQTARKISKHYH